MSRTEPIQSIEVETRFGRVVAHVSGEGSPIVLLHAVGHDHHDFDGVVPALAARHRCFAVDWPGHGDSEMFALPGRASVGAMFGALEDTVAALGIASAIFIGSSVGGAASVHLAAARPELVRGLVLVGSGGFTAQTFVTRAFCRLQARASVRRIIQLPFARSYLRRDTEHTRAILARMKAARARPGLFEMEAAMWRSFATADNDITAIARAVTCPTLVVRGRRDPVISSADGERAAAAIPGARLEILDTGHVPFAEDPPAFLAIVEPFVAGLSEPVASLAS